MRTNSRWFSSAVAVSVAAAAICASMPADAQTGPTLVQQVTSPDGLLTLSLWSANASDAVNVNNTYTWVATNNSPSITLSGVILGSHWGDWCGGPTCTPPGPTLISLGKGCAGQGASEIPLDAHFGVWCVPTTGVTLQPGQSVDGSVTLRPAAGGPPDYTVYSGYNDPVTGRLHFANPLITNRNVVAPAATDIQITGSASNGSPAVGSTFTYTFQVKNAGPWGTYGGVTFVDTLPDSLTYVSSSITVVQPLTGQSVAVADVCSVVGQTVMCRLGELQNGGPNGQTTVTISVTAPSSAGQIVNTASASVVAPQTDSNARNNSVAVTVTPK